MVYAQNKVTILAFVLFAIISTAATFSSAKKYKNLQVLPQDITEKQLDSIMNAYSRALNVSCDFCHKPAKKDIFNITPETGNTDFSLDNEMKENARKMIRMTIDINKKYFYFDSIVRPEFLNVVSCNTCHKGNPFPINE